MESFNFREPFESTDPAGCTGELVAFVGEIHTWGTIVTEPSGNEDHNIFHASISATGTGLTTGAKYELQDVFFNSFNTPNLEAPHGTLIPFDFQIRVISQGSLAISW